MVWIHEVGSDIPRNDINNIAVIPAWIRNESYETVTAAIVRSRINFRLYNQKKRIWPFNQNTLIKHRAFRQSFLQAHYPPCVITKSIILAT